MKKLLSLLLLIPVLGFSQITVKQEVLETGPFEVGDIITVRYEIVDEEASGLDVSLFMFDVNYNNKKVIINGEPTWGTVLNGQLFSRSHWNNFIFTPNTSIPLNDLHAQHDAGGGSYVQDTYWNLLRFTSQSTTDIEGIIVEQKFTILDPDPDFVDYNDAIRINWARIDQRDIDPQVTEQIAGSPRVLDLNARNYTPAGTVTFKVDLPNYDNAEDYIVIVEPRDQFQNGFPESQNPIVYQGSLDLSGNFTTTELRQDVPYIVNVFIKSTYDQQTQTVAYPAWLDDVVTVSDVVLTFKEAIGVNPDGSGTTFEHPIQSILANVVQNSGNDPVDFDDSYALLAHLAGILDNAANSNNQDAEFYPITSFNNGAMNLSAFISQLGIPTQSEEEWLAQRSFTLTSEEAQTFTLGHALMGDVDLSHSSTPKQTAAKGSQKFQMRFIETDIDVISELKDGIVELDVDVVKDDLAGMQMNLRYDDSILTFKEVIFDTGNTMTNFVKPLDGKIIVGTVDPQVENVMKTGRPFRVIFETKQSISNTAGLISFDVTDAVTIEGTKVKLNIR